MNLIPGGHWFARMKDPETEEERLSPLVAWVLRDTGGAMTVSDRLMGIIAKPGEPATELVVADAHPAFVGWAYMPATEFEAGVLSLYTGKPIDFFRAFTQGDGGGQG